MINLMVWRRIWTLLRLGILITLLALLVVPEWPAFGDERYRLQTIVRQEQRFDFFAWTLDALAIKSEGILSDTHAQMPPGSESEFVLDYLDNLRRVQQLELEIERVYGDPDVADPVAAATAKQAEVDRLRAELARRQPVAEAIVQQQVAAILREEGLAIGGFTWPPVLMTMSQVPYLLVVSPRDRIEQLRTVSLVPGLSTEARETMEAAVYDQLDQSALVVPIGGLGTYPAMIRETSNMNWLAEVTAHEWAHHWLSLRPLGVRYLDSAPLRIINETVASIVDLEIGPQVIAQYYPELVPPPAPNSSTAPPPNAPPEPPAFNFRNEMSETRKEVDRLLAEGKIEAAEAYMEARRQVFVENGYNIRKMNQAYFAFYGGYAAEPGGAAGEDPIGPMLRNIRAASGSLRDFLLAVGRITSYDDLVTLHNDLVGGPLDTVLVE